MKIEAFPYEMIKRVMENCREQLQQSIANDDRHLLDMIFKTH